MSRYYSKQLRDDKLKQRRARVAGERRREEEERLRHFGLVNDQEEEPSSLVEMIRNERTAAVFRSPSSLVRSHSCRSPPTLRYGDLAARRAATISYKATSIT